MSGGGPRIGEAIDGFASLSARQLGYHRWNVLDYRDTETGGPACKVYQVDLADLTCSCGETRGKGQVCDHFAVAQYAAPQRLDVDYRHVDGDAVRVPAPEQTGATDADVSDAVEAVEDPVGAVEEWLAANDAPLDKLRVYEHDEYGSVQIEREGDSYFEDHEFDALRDATDHDAVQFDGESNVNYVPRDRVGELEE